MSSNGKRKARRVCSEETKAAALAALLAGVDSKKVAADFNLPEGTVRGWKSKQINGETPVTLTLAQQVDVGGLLVEYLGEGLTTLRYQQTTLFRDPKWLQKQSANDMAILHGVIADKCARLLEAMSGMTLPPAIAA